MCIHPDLPCHEISNDDANTPGATAQFMELSSIHVGSSVGVPYLLQMGLSFSYSDSMHFDIHTRSQSRLYKMTCVPHSRSNTHLQPLLDRK